VRASDLIGLLQRVDPAEPDDRNAGRRRSRNRLAIMGADEKQPGAGTGQIFQLPSAMRPVHAQTHAEPLGFALHSILDLHVELAVDRIEIVKNNGDIVGTRLGRRFGIAKTYGHLANALARFLADAALAR